jgi:hypothetical protein
VPTDNPYCGSQAARGEIWAAGLRNPWRCRFRDDGRLLCGDVGQDTWEEINVIFEANNYGWPTTEGPFTLAQFPTFTPPIYSYGHNGSDAAIMAGDFGNKTVFPGDYAESYFFGDYPRGFIRSVVLDPSGTAIVSPPTDFATGIGNNTLTEIIAGPDGALYYTRIAHGDVHRILLITGNHSPIAVVSPTSTSGSPPLMVAFDGTASSDPDNDPLTFTWDFGDGTAPGTGPTPPAHQYSQRGLYTVTLTVSDGMPGPGPGVATATVAVGNPPAVTISQPVDGSSFDAGMMVPRVGSATDVEDGAIAADKLTWKIVFHHSDHTHPFIDALPSTPNSFTTAKSGETSADVAYEIILSATDSDGMTGSNSVMLVPNTAGMSFETVPPGLETTLDGEPHVTPFEVTSVVGMQRTIGASDAPALTFTSWSDGGASTHVVTVPAGATTYVATFATPAPSLTSAAPTATPTPAPSLTSATETSTPTASITTPAPTETRTAAPTVTIPDALTSATPTSTSTGSATPSASSTAPSTPVPTSTPIGLADSAAARDADTCQHTIAETTLALASTTLAALTRCTTAVQVCVQSSPDDVACTPKAQATCLKATGSITNASAKMIARVQRRCTDVENVMSALGVGYADLAADCTARGNPANDVTGLASCLAQRNRCTTETLFQLEVPRAWELLRLADIGLPAGSCLTSHGETGGGVAPTEAKALMTCTATISKAATAFLSARAGALGDCATALFTCVERKPAPADRAKCLAKADTVCARATDPSADDTKLRATIEGRCNALPFATLRTAAGVNLDGVTGDCAAQGVADLASLALFEECLAHQHGCLATELVRAAVPRSPGLLALVGRALAPTDCPPADGTAALH